MASNAEKISETQIHETLYKNIFVLTQLYPPPNKDLHDILRKDMFVKNNRTAFNQVIYYLLYTLNSECIQAKITSWPVFDPQYERQFRSEVMKYLNELNEMYEDANMPSIMASQLVSPGGLKFTKYMLKLTMLVMTRCLQQNENVRRKMLLKPKLQKSGKNADGQIKRINAIRTCTNNETEKMKEEFHIKFMEYKEIANTIVDKINKIQCDTQILKEKLKLMQSTEKKDNFDAQEIDAKIEFVKEKLTKLKENSNKLSEIKDLVLYLTKRDLPLKGNSSDELDLMTTLENFNLKMEEHCFNMKTLTDIELNKNIEKFRKCNEELTRLKNNWISLHQECMQVYGVLKATSTSNLKTSILLEAPTSSCDSTILAIPLENSKS